MSFKAVFETLPLIELPDWKGLRVTVKGPAVAEADVDKEIDRLREEAARYDPVDEARPTQAGDYVLLDLAWKPVDGGKGGHDENALIEIGNAGNHADMNKGLEGLSLAETRTIEVAWGEDAAPQIAGKTVRYTVTLKGIKKKVVPAADDEFAKDLGEFDSLGALRDKVRAQLEAARWQEQELQQPVGQEKAPGRRHDYRDRRHQDAASQLFEVILQRAPVRTTHVVRRFPHWLQKRAAAGLAAPHAVHRSSAACGGVVVSAFGRASSVKPSARSRAPLRNEEKVFPSQRPSWGSRFGPKMTSATTTITIRSSGWRPKGIRSSCTHRRTRRTRAQAPRAGASLAGTAEDITVEHEVGERGAVGAPGRSQE